MVFNFCQYFITIKLLSLKTQLNPDPFFNESTKSFFASCVYSSFNWVFCTYNQRLIEFYNM